MNLALYIYLCEVVGNFGCTLVVGIVVAIVSLVITGFVTAVTENFRDSYNKENEKQCRDIRNKIVKALIAVVIVCSIVRTVTPSQKTMYAMAAAYYGEQAVKSETFQRLNGKAMQLLEVKIDELIGEKKESK